MKTASAPLREPDIMGTMTIKNRSLKISPGGIVTLSLAARKTLRMEPGKGCRVTVAMGNHCVSLKPTGEQGGTRVSAKGQIELAGEPRTLLESGVERHYWLQIDDDKQIVELHPFTKG
jgi:hypothetical protein